jgi:2'-hydroxyisoflavone reductase
MAGSERILVIGGTHFVGHAMAQAALDAGHDVTLLHRNPTDELPGATHLLADRNGDLAVLDGQEWDATIDVCAYVPSQVRRLAEALDGRGGHHVFVSTVSVYREPAGPDADEDSALLDEPAEDTEEVTNETYGPLKVACERVAREAYGEDSLAIVRPTYVVGPRDATARYPWWPLRAARGGPMIAPGPLDAPMQCIDARDLGAWTVRLGEARVTGAFTAARPWTTFGELLDETLGAVDSDAALVPVDGDWLVEQGVDGLQLPLWTEGGPEWSLAMATSRAEAAGLTHRPFADVVRDTLAWARSNPDQATNDRWGLAPEREQELLTAWRATQA